MKPDTKVSGFFVDNLGREEPMRIDLGSPKGSANRKKRSIIRKKARKKCFVFLNKHYKIKKTRAVRINDIFLKD